MGALLSIFGSSIWGSLFGSLFSWLNKREETAELRVKNDHDEKMLSLQNAQAIALADKNMQATQVQGAVIVQAKEADAFVASQQSAFTPTSSILVEILRGVMRPMITVYMLAVATYFAVNISALVGGLKSLDPATVFSLYGSIIDELFFLTNLVVSWWFGARGSSKRQPIVGAPPPPPAAASS